MAQVFSCESFKISNNTVFTEHLWETASVCLNNGFRISEKKLKYNTIVYIKITCQNRIYNKLDNN